MHCTIRRLCQEWPGPSYISFNLCVTNRTNFISLAHYCLRSSMDRMSDSGSDDGGSNPFEDTEKPIYDK